MPKLLNEAKEQAAARKHRVVVYGTLRRKQHNNAVLGDSKFLGTIVIPKEEGLAMLDAAQGAFPIVLPAKQAKVKATSIIAELYAVDGETLKRLDRLEGVPTMYQRKRITVRSRGQDVSAIIYQPVEKFFDLDDPQQIEDGNWNAYAERIEKEDGERQAKDIKQQATGRPEEFFHVSLTKDEPSVLRKGLKPQVGGLSAKAGETESRIHLFPSEDDLENALMNWLGDELPDDEGITIFKVKLPSEFPVKPTFERGEGSWEWWTDQPIPAQHLSVHSREDAEDAPSEGDDEDDSYGSNNV